MFLWWRETSKHIVLISYRITYPSSLYGLSSLLCYPSLLWLMLYGTLWHQVNLGQNKHQQFILKMLFWNKFCHSGDFQLMVQTCCWGWNISTLQNTLRSLMLTATITSPQRVSYFLTVLFNLHMQDFKWLVLYTTGTMTFQLYITIPIIAIKNIILW